MDVRNVIRWSTSVRAARAASDEEMLRLVLELKRACADAIALQVIHMRDNGSSWGTIARLLNTTRQNAQQTYGGSGKRFGDYSPLQPRLFGEPENVPALS